MSKPQGFMEIVSQMLKYTALYILMLLIYFTFFFKTPDNIAEYASELIHENHAISSAKHQIQSNSLLIDINPEDASIYKMQSTKYENSLEDSSVFFGAQSQILPIKDRIWLEFRLNDEKINIKHWQVTHIGKDFIEYAWSDSSLEITQRYQMNGNLISIDIKIINKTNMMQKIQCSHYMSCHDMNEAMQTGFVASSGLKIKGLDSATLRKNIYKTRSAKWAGVIKKYWLIGSHHASASLEKTIYMLDVNEKFYMINQLDAVNIQPNMLHQEKMQIYAGPKHSKELLSAENQTKTGLLQIIDYGWLSWLNALIRMIMEWLLELCSRADYALLAFVLIMRLLLLYPYILSEKHARRIVMLESKVNQIKERYMSEELIEQKTSELYKIYGVNKYLASFPMFVQIFWFIPLNILSQLFIIRGASFFNLCADMSALDTTSWTNLFGLLSYPSYHIRWINFGWWVVLFVCTYLISEDLSRMDKMFIIFMILSTIVFYKNLPVLFTIFWCIINIIGAVQTRLLKKFLHVSLEKI